MVKIGDILVGHYGYSIEVYHFYVITRMTAKSVTLQRIAKKQIGGDGFRPIVTPDISTKQEHRNLAFLKDGETISFWAKAEGSSFTRRLGKTYVKDHNESGIIYLENISEEKMKEGYQEDYLD